MYNPYTPGNYYNPQSFYMQQQQQRLNQMQQAFPYYNQQTYTNQQEYGMQVQGLKGRPVSSIDEAKASMIDLDGSVYVFPDINNKRIYTKQVNMDGTASLYTYVRVENNNEQQNNGNKSNGIIAGIEADDIPSPDDFRMMKQKIAELEGRIKQYDELWAISTVNADESKSTTNNSTNGETKPINAQSYRNGTGKNATRN